MVSINYAFKEIISKIVYYGPGLSGKTTNLQHVFKKVPAETRGELISLATDADRTLYFDFLPVNVGTIKGFATKFQLYTVPGQVYYNATRKLVLRGVDGLVFVADSQLAKMDENIESLHNLKENLTEYGYDIAQIPLVIQYNKRDVPQIATIGQLQEILNRENRPYFEAVAVTGEGVFKTLKAICNLVLDDVRAKRMEATRAIKAQPLTETSTSVLKSLSNATSKIATLAEVTVAARGDDETSTRQIPTIVSEAETHTTVVVSDVPEKKVPENDERPQVIEEKLEKAVLRDENGTSEQKYFDESPYVPQSPGILKDERPEELPSFSRFGYSYIGDDFQQRTADLEQRSPLLAGKPQMAESRKVKNKKGRFNPFKWFRKSRKNE